jgi:DNA-binding transcriptional LysR family regulator
MSTIAKPAPDLVGMIAFVRVAEFGSFVRAAASLELSKAAVSKQVALLEARLGARLLHRTTRRLSLTEAGQAYLRYAQSALAEAHAAEGAVAQSTNVAQGRLRVTAPMSFGVMHVAPWLAAFQREHPLVEIDLQLDDRSRDLVLEGLDLALRFGTTLADSSLVARRIGSSRTLLAASPGYLAEHGRPAHPEELNTHSCMHFSLYPARTWELTRAGQTLRVAPGSRLEANSTLALRVVMLAGGGIVRVPEFAVADDLARGDLEVVLPEWTLPEIVMYAVMPERRYVPAKVRVFVEFLSKMWKTTPGWRTVPGKKVRR